MLLILLLFAFSCSWGDTQPADKEKDPNSDKQKTHNDLVEANLYGNVKAAHSYYFSDNQFTEDNLGATDTAIAFRKIGCYYNPDGMMTMTTIVTDFSYITNQTYNAKFGSTSVSSFDADGRRVSTLEHVWNNLEDSIRYTTYRTNTTWINDYEYTDTTLGETGKVISITTTYLDENLLLRLVDYKKYIRDESLIYQTQTTFTRNADGQISKITDVSSDEENPFVHFYTYKEFDSSGNPTLILIDQENGDSKTKHLLYRTYEYYE